MRTKTLLSLVILFHAFVFSQENAEELGNLPSVISETSGLLFHNGKLITHNDSGNTPQLFEIDTVTLQITRTVTVLNVDNVDWEDLAQDIDYIYIGDFGNNVGTRSDLAVYRIRKQDYDSSDTVQAERLDFSYVDQLDFTDSGNSDWDAEAFFVLDNDLIILTKQWKSNGTVAYSIPKTPGTHVAQRIEDFDSNGLITGATYNPLSDVLFIIGYSSILGPFTIRIDQPTTTSIFGITAERIPFGGGLAQVEGIAYVDVNTYFVSSEFFTNASPSITLQSKLFSFKTVDMTEEEDPEQSEEPEEPEDAEMPTLESQEQNLLLYRAFGSNELEYELNTDRAIFGRAIFDATGKRIQYTLGEEIEGSTIDLSYFGSAVYYLTFYLDNGVIAKAFTK